MTMIRAMLQQLTILDIRDVMERMSEKDLLFVRRMIETSQSGTGFVNDIAHRVDDLSGIAAPVLVIYSLNDKFVPPKNAKRVEIEVVQSELYKVAADSHLIWIGRTAEEVRQKRLSFLRSD